MDVNVSLCKKCPTSSKIDEASEEFKELKKTLPPGYEYSLCELYLGDKNPTEANLKLKITTEKEAKSWLKQYQNLSRTTWRTRCTHPHNGRKLICRLERMCHHNTRVRADPQQNRRTKNTGCPAFLNIRVRRLLFATSDTGRMRSSRSTDPHYPEWPTSVTFSGSHNHPIDDPSILSHRDVSQSVKMKLIKLFQDGLSATEALKIHKSDLAREHGHDYNKVVADRHFCPDAQFCYRLYYDIFRKDTKSLSRRKVQELLEERISKYNDENGICICSQIVDGIGVLAIVTPLMKRVHNMVPSAGETVFVNNFISGPGLPQLFMLMTDSLAGGLPLGCFILGSESSIAIHQGLEMIHELVGVGAYHGRGRDGPQVFLTSNSVEERLALRQMYPSTKQVLCIFHILQAFWQFLFGEQHQIAESDRYYLFHQMKALAYCSSEHEVQTKFKGLIEDPLILKYNFVVTHFKEVFETRTHWALFHLDADCALWRNASNNFCNAMSVLKDRPYEKLKSANAFQLFDLVISRVDGHCKNRLEDLAAGKWSRILAHRYGSIHRLSAFDKDYINEEQPLVFTMPLKEKSNQSRVWVDMNMGFCSCTTGITGGACKHQYVIIRYFNVQKWKFDHVSNDAASKKWLTTIAQGDTVSDLDQLFARLKEALQRDPGRFTKPFGSFIIKWSQYERDDELVEALQEFTKLKNTHHAKRKNTEDSSTKEENGTKIARVETSISGLGVVQPCSEQDAPQRDIGSLQNSQEMDIASEVVSAVEVTTTTSQKSQTSAPKVKTSIGGVGVVKPSSEQDAPPRVINICTLQNSQEMDIASEVVSAVEVIASSQKSQTSAPVIEHVTNGQRVTLPTTSVGHEALSGLANMAEQAEKIVRTAFTEGSLSGESSTKTINLESEMESVDQQASCDGGLEPVIVGLVM